MLISTRLKELRTEKGLNQGQLAEMLGITQDSISLWEKGKRTPDTQYIYRLCDVLQVSADYLLGRTDDFGNILTQSSTLAENEETLLHYFRAPNSELQSAALETVRVLAGIPAGSGLQKKA